METFKEMTRADAVNVDGLSMEETHQQRAWRAFNEGTLCDVDFIVGEDGDGKGELIRAHKFVLSLSSPVFGAMFNGPLAAGKEVKVPDVDPQAFRALLKYVYTGKLESDPEIVMRTLYAAKKYLLLGLQNACKDLLLKSVTGKNAVSLLSQAMVLDEKQLTEKCLAFVDANTDVAFKGNGFTDIDFKLLCSLLERNTLHIREIAVYDALRRWACEECKRRGLPADDANARSVAGKAFSLIRFPVMTAAEFAAGPAKSGLLTDREIIDLFVYYASDPKPTTSFISEPRQLFRVPVVDKKTINPAKPRFNKSPYEVSNDRRSLTSVRITMKNISRLKSFSNFMSQEPENYRQFI